MTKFINHPTGRYDIFRGKTDSSRWYVYDTKEQRYVGGSFDTMKGAKTWVRDNGE